MSDTNFVENIWIFASKICDHDLGRKDKVKYILNKGIVLPNIIGLNAIQPHALTGTFEDSKGFVKAEGQHHCNKVVLLGFLRHGKYSWSKCKSVNGRCDLWCGDEFLSGFWCKSFF